MQTVLEIFFPNSFRAIGKMLAFGTMKRLESMEIIPRPKSPVLTKINEWSVKILLFLLSVLYFMLRLYKKHKVLIIDFMVSRIFTDFECPDQYEPSLRVSEVFEIYLIQSSCAVWSKHKGGLIISKKLKK